jgi:hypothetical protein
MDESRVMNKSLKELVELIEELDTKSISLHGSDSYRFRKEDEAECLVKLNRCYSIADEMLITSEGQVNWIAVGELTSMNKSLEVFPIEQDRFGWLLGGIRTKKGLITFG